MKRNIRTLITALLFIAALLLITSIEASAQRWRLLRYQVDLSLSGVSFHGDVGLANKPFANSFNGARPGVGITPRFYMTPAFAVSLDLGYVIYGGRDEEGSSHTRYWSFNSHAFQHFGRLEYYITSRTRYRGGNAIYNRRGLINNYNTAHIYLFAGGGGILSKSKIMNIETGREVSSEDVGGEGYDNSLHYSIGFPGGAGFRITLDPRWNIGAELSYQYVLSDYLDGYDIKWSHSPDSYYLISVRATYQLSNTRGGRPLFRKYYR